MTPPAEIRTKRGRAQFDDGTVRFEGSVAGFLFAILYGLAFSRGNSATAGGACRGSWSAWSSAAG